MREKGPFQCLGFGTQVLDPSQWRDFWNLSLRGLNKILDPSLNLLCNWPDQVSTQLKQHCNQNVCSGQIILYAVRSCPIRMKPDWGSWFQAPRVGGCLNGQCGTSNSRPLDKAVCRRMCSQFCHARSLCKLQCDMLLAEIFVCLILHLRWGQAGCTPACAGPTETSSTLQWLTNTEKWDQSFITCSSVLCGPWEMEDMHTFSADFSSTGIVPCAQTMGPKFRVPTETVIPVKKKDERLPRPIRIFHNRHACNSLCGKQTWSQETGMKIWTSLSG